MALTSKIMPYDSHWPDQFAVEKERVAQSFGPELADIYHVGSTAVPGLAAKPEIDLLIEVAEHRDQETRDACMRMLGYVRGTGLSQGHHFYRRDVDGVRTHKVHVCISGHWQIDRMLRFRDLLRNDPVVRQQYEDLKLRLEADNQKGIGEYLAQKAPFIDALMGPKPTLLRRRPSARILLIDQFGCVLLFKFVHSSGVLAGRVYWATPGGAVDEGETFEAAAVRELQEETGILRQETGGEVGRRSFELQLVDGERVWADERFFVVRADRGAISDEGWSDNERDVMADYRWWSTDELQGTSDTIFPDRILDLLKAARVTRKS